MHCHSSLLEDVYSDQGLNWCVLWRWWKNILRKVFCWRMISLNTSPWPYPRVVSYNIYQEYQRHNVHQAQQRNKPPKTLLVYSETKYNVFFTGIRFERHLTILSHTYCLSFTARIISVSLHGRLAGLSVVSLRPCLLSSATAPRKHTATACSLLYRLQYCPSEGPEPTLVSDEATLEITQCLWLAVQNDLLRTWVPFNIWRLHCLIRGGAPARYHATLKHFITQRAMETDLHDPCSGVYCTSTFNKHRTRIYPLSRTKHSSQPSRLSKVTIATVDRLLNTASSLHRYLDY